jgi:hypothetical protein
MTPDPCDPVPGGCRGHAQPGVSHRYFWHSLFRGPAVHGAGPRRWTAADWLATCGCAFSLGVQRLNTAGRPRPRRPGYPLGHLYHLLHLHGLGDVLVELLPPPRRAIQPHRLNISWD